MIIRNTLVTAGSLARPWPDLGVVHRRASAANSRARQMGAQGQIIGTDLAEKLAATEGKCSDCSKPFGSQRRNKWTICFREPLSRGGECTVANTDIVCGACGMSRAAKLGVKLEGPGRARATRKVQRASVSLGPAESPRTPPLAFRDDEDEKG